jgi:hypothetical protein
MDAFFEQKRHAEEFSLFGEEVGIFQREFHEVAANDFGLEVGTDEVSTLKSVACCTSGA